MDNIQDIEISDNDHCSVIVACNDGDKKTTTKMIIVSSDCRGIDKKKKCVIKIRSKGSE